jgi:hypothetical protein
MLDPRIYRMGLLLVLLGLIVVGFSLGDQQSALSTNIVPDAFNGSNAYSAMESLSSAYPDRRPGSVGDQELAGHVAKALQSYGFSVSNDRLRAPTAEGPRTLDNVVGIQAGAGSGDIVVVSHRDSLSPRSPASLSGTAVMLELARVLSGQALNRTLVLVSTSGSDGAAGVAHLTSELPGPVDAVIVLGDLAATSVRQPLLVPWSDGQEVAPTLLRNTVSSALTGQTGLSTGDGGLPRQLAHLAFPMSGSEQAPLIGQGLPAVLLSLSGGHDPTPGELISPAHLTGTGRAVLQAVTALQSPTAVPGPSSYLLWAGKVIPAWAMRLLVLTLIIPVLALTVDGVARARRKGHVISRWVVWVLCAGLPFGLAALLVEVARWTGWIGPALPAPVAAGVVPIGAGGIALLVLMAILICGGLVWLRPLLVRVLGAGAPSGEPERRARQISGPARLRDEAAGPDAGAAAGTLLVMCVMVLAVWFSNPFAALLLLPALHLWPWVVAPGRRPPIAVSVLLLLVGLAAPALLAAYFATSFGLGPVGVAWSGVLLLAGGGVGLLSALEWSVLAGCALSVGLAVLRSARLQRDEKVTVTVRGPVSYAGPGSLGGTESALRR